MRKLILISALFLYGCDQPPQPVKIQSSVGADGERFTVLQVAKFDDSDAYNSSRKIFLITDKQTGNEYVGVSGVGISEFGSHTYSSGKQVLSARDER